MPTPLYLDEPFIKEPSSQQCLKFSRHLKDVLSTYIKEIQLLKQGIFSTTRGKMRKVGQAITLAGGVVPLPGHVGAYLQVMANALNEEQVKGLASKIYQKIDAADTQALEDFIDSIVKQLTRQYQTQLELLESLGDKKVAEPIHEMLDPKERFKKLAHQMKDAVYDNGVVFSDAQLVAQCAAARIIRYMESHRNDEPPTLFSLAPVSSHSVISNLNTIYVEIKKDSLHYQLLHPKGEVISGEISVEELGFSLNEDQDISTLQRHSLPRILAILGKRGHISPVNVPSEPAYRWTPSELIAAAQGGHGMNQNIEDKKYGNLTVHINRHGKQTRWLVSDLFSRPGLCVENPFLLTKTFYHDDASERTNTKEYGYRLGTQEEANYLRYPVVQRIHYSPQFLSHETVPQCELSPIELNTILNQKQNQLDALFSCCVGTQEAIENLFDQVNILNLEYSKQTKPEAFYPKIKENYFLFIRHAEAVLDAKPSFSISVYTQMAQLFTVLNDPHTAWAFYCKAVSITENQPSQALTSDQLHCEYQHAFSTLRLLVQSYQHQHRLETFKTKLVNSNDPQLTLHDMASLWEAHGIKIEWIRMHYFTTPDKPKFSQWLIEGINEVSSVYNIIPEKVFELGTRMADAYLQIGQIKKVNEIYHVLKPILSAREKGYMDQLDACQTKDVSAFNHLLSEFYQPLLLQYQAHQQYEQGRDLIHAVFKRAKNFVSNKPDLNRLIGGSQFEINDKGAVRTSSTNATSLQITGIVSLPSYTRMLNNTTTVIGKKHSWMALLQTVIARQTSHLGEPPCAFSLLYLKPLKASTFKHLTLRLLLAKPQAALRPTEMLYFDTLLTVILNVVHNFEGKWKIDEQNQLIRLGMQVDPTCYSQSSCTKWSTSHIHTPEELARLVIAQWNNTALPNELVTPVALYDSSLFKAYEACFSLINPSLFITTQCIDETSSPLTIRNHNTVFYLSPSVTSALLNQARTTLRPKNKWQPGNHTVIPIWTKPEIDVGNLPDYYVKLWPEHPGRSFACARLAQRLLGGGVVHSTAHLLTYPVPNDTPKQLCAEFIERAKGRSLFDWLSPDDAITKMPLPADVIEQNLTMLNRLSSAEFTKHLLLSICFYLEDESPRNIFFDATTSSLTKIDVERVFLTQTKKPKNSHNKDLTIKSILFCMDNMQDLLDEATLLHFVGLDIFQEIEEWLKELEEENKRHRDIFLHHITTLYQPHIQSIFGKTSNRESSLVGVIFPDHILPDLLERLLALQNEIRISLSNHESLTGLGLLRSVAANVYSYYNPLFDEETDPLLHTAQEKNKHAFSRFKALTTGLYQKETWISLKTSDEIEGIYQDSEIANILHGRQDSPTNALSSLEQFKKVTEKSALDELKAGRPFLFRWLQEDKKALVLQRLVQESETLTFPPSAQRALLNTLATCPLRSLTLTPFAAILDDNLLKRTIQNTGYYIQNLNVTNCSLLTQKSVQIIAEYCPNVQILDMSATHLTVFESKSSAAKIEFPYCKQLILNNCKKLQHINGLEKKLPSLRYLDITGCESLKRLELCAPKIKMIRGLESCPTLKGKDVFQRYPWLIGLSISVSNNIDQRYQTIAEILETTFTENHLNDVRMTSSIILELLDYFNIRIKHKDLIVTKSISNLNRWTKHLQALMALLYLGKEYADEAFFTALLARAQGMDYAFIVAAHHYGTAFGDRIVPTLLEMLKNYSAVDISSGRVGGKFNLLVRAISKVGQDNVEVVNSLLPLLKYGYQNVAQALGEVGYKYREVIVPELLNILNDTHRGYDGFGCAVIASLGSLGDGNEEPIVDVLLQKLSTEEEFTHRRIAIITSLASLGQKQAVSIIPALLQIIDKTGDLDIHEAAVDALRKLGYEHLDLRTKKLHEDIRQQINLEIQKGNNAEALRRLKHLKTRLSGNVKNLADFNAVHEEIARLTEEIGNKIREIGSQKISQTLEALNKNRDFRLFRKLSELIPTYFEFIPSDLSEKVVLHLFKILNKMTEPEENRKEAAKCLTHAVKSHSEIIIPNLIKLLGSELKETLYSTLTYGDNYYQSSIVDALRMGKNHISEIVPALMGHYRFEETLDIAWCLKHLLTPNKDDLNEILKRHRAHYLPLYETIPRVLPTRENLASVPILQEKLETSTSTHLHSLSLLLSPELPRKETASESVSSGEIPMDEISAYKMSLTFFPPVFSHEQPQAPQIKGLIYQPVPGDGHCLFHAVALYTGQAHVELRNLVADKLQSRENREEFSSVVNALTNGTKTLEEYAHIVRSSSEYADNMEIAILMMALNRPIVVINNDGSIRNHPDFEKYEKEEPIFVHHNGRDDNAAHYNALILEGEDHSAKNILRTLLSSKHAAYASYRGK